jgi:ubiquinone/menaquinone biosynthesis C-methylase UbiE
MTVLDVGCGMGVNAIAMARLVGDEGHVIAVDVQPRMLDIMQKRARRAGVAGRIRARKCEPDSIGVSVEVGFAVAFWMVHEVPNVASFLREIHFCLSPGGRFLLAEPRDRVSEAAFRETLGVAASVGLRLVEEPRIRLSRAALFLKA